LRNHLQYRRTDAAKRCAICDGKFGLIRHYSRRTALCSRRCVDRFKSREESDRRWLLCLHTTQLLRSQSSDFETRRLRNEPFMQAPAVELSRRLLAKRATQIVLAGAT
jgi:hypothetical protein